MFQYGTESDAYTCLGLLLTCTWAVIYTYTEGVWSAVIRLGFWICYGFPWRSENSDSFCTTPNANKGKFTWSKEDFTFRNLQGKNCRSHGNSVFTKAMETQNYKFIGLQRYNAHTHTHSHSGTEGLTWWTSNDAVVWNKAQADVSSIPRNVKVSLTECW